MSSYSRRQFILATTGLAFTGSSIAKSPKSKAQKISNDHYVDSTIEANVSTSNLAHSIPYNPSAGINKDRGLLICGSGDYMLAWTIGYFYALHQSGVDLSSAEIIVGSSAGAIAGSAIATGHLQHLIAELNFFVDMPHLLAELVVNTKINPSQKRALQLCLAVKDGKLASIQEIGKAALAAHTTSPRNYESTIKRLVGKRTWPADKLYITANDCYTGERLVISHIDNIPIEQACTASNAWPGLKTPVWLGDRVCMDGGVSETTTHADILSGAKRVLVLSLNDGSAQVKQDGLSLTALPNTLQKDIASLNKSGSQTLLVAAGLPPGKKTVDLLDPKLIGQGLTYGFVRGIAGASQVKQFWS